MLFAATDRTKIIHPARNLGPEHIEVVMPQPKRRNGTTMTQASEMASSASRSINGINGIKGQTFEAMHRLKPEPVET